MLDEVTPPIALNRRQRRHPPRVIDLSQPGYLRLDDVLMVFPVSRSSWYQGIKDGKYPASVALGKRSRGWHTGVIKTLVENPPFAPVVP